jgi:glycosyltransferase involved in cell wall biosynthesis
MRRIGFFDTTNYTNFPVGGILTSIQNFIMYLSENSENLDHIILIGISNCANYQAGSIYEIYIYGKKVKFLPIANIEYDENHPHKSLRKLFVKTLMKNKDILKRLEVDVCLIHTPEAYLPLRLFLPNTKKVIFSHGNYFDLINFLRFGKSNWFVKKMIEGYIKYLLKHANAIFVLDKKTYDQYRLYNKNIFKVCNSIINNEFIRSCASDKYELINLVYVGRLSKNKGIEEIIYSIKKLDQGKFLLNIIGAGEEYDHLNKFIEENGLLNNVRLLGKKDRRELKEIYSKADILIMNSQTEGSPMVILEALASGIPVVSTNVGNIGEMIIEEYNGEFTDGTSDMIADKILKIERKMNFYKENSYKSSMRYNYIKVNEIINNLLNSI